MWTRRQRQMCIRDRYERTLELLKRTREYSPKVYTKSGFMLGLGEKNEEVFSLLKDLKRNFVDIVTIGQYLSPGPNHLPVQKFVSPSKSVSYTHLTLPTSPHV